MYICTNTFYLGNGKLFRISGYGRETESDRDSFDMNIYYFKHFFNFFFRCKVNTINFTGFHSVIVCGGLVGGKAPL